MAAIDRMAGTSVLPVGFWQDGVPTQWDKATTVEGLQHQPAWSTSAMVQYEVADHWRIQARDLRGAGMELEAVLGRSAPLASA